MTPVIEAVGVRKEIMMGKDHIPILRGINLAVHQNEFVAIMGPSGSGKSTLLGLMAGLDTPTAGQIRLDGQEISSMSEDQLARLRARMVGIVFQSFHLIPTLTALENVSVPLELSGAGKAARQTAEAMLQRVGLSHRLHHYPRQMSGGEQQRVAVARAFAPSPAVIFADEPTGNLDSQNGRAVMNLIVEQVRSAGTAMVLVTHDPNLAALADRTIYIQDGTVVREEGIRHGTPAR